MATTVAPQSDVPDETANYGDKSSPFIDFSAIIRSLKRNIWIFVIAAVVTALAIIGTYFLLTPVYRATSQVEISTDTQNVVNTEEVVAGKLPDTYVVDTKVQILKSRTIALAAVNRLRLYDNAEFIGEQAGTLEERKLRAAANLSSKLKVERSGLSYVIAITFESPSAAMSARVANVIAEEFIKQDLQSRIIATQSATAFLQRRVDELRSEVLRDEQAVQSYRAANNLLSKTPENLSEIDAIATINTELAEARAEAAASNRRSSGSAQSTSQLLEVLRKQEADIDGRIADLGSRYGPRHPDLQRVLRERADIQAQIAQERRRIAGSSSVDSQSANARVASLQGSLNAARSQVAAQNAAQVRLAELERSAEASRTLYQTYLNRLRETTAQQGLETSGSRILSLTAEPSLPASPNPFLFLAMAVIGGLAAGSFATAVAEARDSTIRTAAGVRENLGISTLATVPQFRSALSPDERKQHGEMNPDFVIDRPHSGFAESFRMLKSSLIERRSGTPYQVVAITSALPREGKTTTSVALARIAGFDGFKSVLVECDNRRRSTAAVQRVSKGILEVLHGTATLDEALLYDEKSRTFILPVAKVNNESTDLSSAGDFDALLEQLRARFEFIVLDLPPVLPIAESRLLAMKADAVAYVVRWGSTSKHASDAGLKLLNDVGARVRGAVITQVNLDKQRNWSKNDASSYYHLYSDYYK